MANTGRLASIGARIVLLGAAGGAAVGVAFGLAHAGLSPWSRAILVALVVAAVVPLALGPRPARRRARVGIGLASGVALGLVVLVSAAFAPPDAEGDGLAVEALLPRVAALEAAYRTRTGRFAPTLGDLGGAPAELVAGTGHGYVYRYASFRKGADWGLAADPCPPRPGCPSFVVGSGREFARGPAPFPLE
jgi:hypothetical protein